MLLLAMSFLSVAASTLGAQQTAGGARANVPFGTWSGTFAFPGGDELHESRVGWNIDEDGKVYGGFVADTDTAPFRRHSP